MSRLGRKPVPIPEKVKVTINGQHIHAEGPQGKLDRDIPHGITAKVEGKDVIVARVDDSTRLKSLHGTLRKVILNMVEGVATGFTKGLQIEGVGFRAQSVGEKITMTLGYSHIVEYVVPKGIKVTIDPKQTALTVQGADRELVGEVAAQIRRFKPPEPYKGTGIRYQDEHIRRKAGKAAVGAGTAGAGGKK